MAEVRVVTLDAQVPGLLAHVIRNLLRLLDSLPAGYVIGLISTLVTSNAVRIGDIAADTLLIYDTDASAGTFDVAQLNPEVAQRHGLATAELGQDLLNRWNALDSKYSTVATSNWAVIVSTCAGRLSPANKAGNRFTIAPNTARGNILP